MAPILQQIAGETDFNVVKIDIDASSDNKELAIPYRVQGIPNMKIFVDGKEVAELVGMKSKQTLVDALEKSAKK